ncbi:MAG TPA: CPBP family intramembrane glutamic endopeptidase [Gemmatimonadales bacterium]
MAEGGLLLAAVIVGRAVGVHPFSQFAFTAPALILGVLTTGPLLLGLGWSLHTQWPPLARLVTFVEQRLRPLFLGCHPSQLALIALLAGVAEEALFRGVVQLALGRWLSPWGGLTAASLLFGLAHFLTLSYALVAALVGFYLGGLLLLSGNLLTPIVVHALYDLIALIVLIRLEPRNITA